MFDLIKGNPTFYQESLCYFSMKILSGKTDARKYYMITGFKNMMPRSLVNICQSFEALSLFNFYTEDGCKRFS
jgi:hypothetical protein